MSDSHKRQVALPRSLWGEIDADAKRCGRSSLKQLEMILTVYYRLGNIDLKDLTQVRDLVSPNLVKEPAGPRRVKKG